MNKSFEIQLSQAPVKYNQVGWLVLEHEKIDMQ